MATEKNEWTVVGVTGLIGLLHGLDFSFVLQNILQVTSPNIGQSQWCLKFTPSFAKSLRKKQGALGDQWFLDEVNWGQSTN